MPKDDNKSWIHFLSHFIIYMGEEGRAFTCCLVCQSCFSSSLASSHIYGSCMANFTYHQQLKLQMIK